MEIFTIVFENVEYAGQTIEEPITIGGVLLAPTPPDPGFSTSFETGAIIQVSASALDEAERQADLLLANAVTVLTYAVCRLAMPEGQGKFNMLMAIRVLKKEDNKTRKWREGVQGMTESSPSADADHVRVIRSLASRGLPYKPNGVLSTIVSGPVAQRLLQILSDRQSSSSTDHTRSLAFALTYLQRSVESEGAHSLIDAISGLETLFGPRGTDPFYPIAATVGYGVSYTSADRTDPDKRLETWKRVKSIYRERSQLVHGDRLSSTAPDAISDALKMLVESIEFCVKHESEIVACGGITQWVEKAHFGCPQALVPQETSPS
ncbi:hypothetical protein LLF88_06280 [bacterium]|nr:hypothetical protein [bacterium]